MSPDLIKLLEQFLETAETLCGKFSNNMSDVKKKEIAIDFQSKILNILEYSYLYLPVDKKILKEHYPRPSPRESKEDYILRSDHKPKTSPLILKDFLSNCFDLNLKYNEAISYVSGQVKHKNPNEFGENITPKLDAKFESSHPNPINFNTDGGLEILGFITADSASSISISKSCFHSPNGFLSIESLEFGGGKFEGGLIMFKDGEKRLFTDWATDCMNFCKEVIIYSRTI